MQPMTSRALIRSAASRPMAGNIHISFLTNGFLISSAGSRPFADSKERLQSLGRYW